MMFFFYRSLLLSIIGFAFAGHFAQAQVEHTPISHPVYDFLRRAEVLGALESFSLTCLPLERGKITTALKKIGIKPDLLTKSDQQQLRLFEQEFGLKLGENAVLIPSESDSAQVLFARLFGDDEKYVYRYRSDSDNVSVVPLAEIEYRNEKREIADSSAILGQAGIRLFGTIRSWLGYYLQITNGSVLSGARSVAADDPLLRRNIKFTMYNSDFDFTESHISVRKDWFFGSLGRETRLWGMGVNNALFISNNSPAFDALTLGADFTHFEYRFMHASLLAIPTSSAQSGISAEIPSKFLAFHRFAYQGKNLEIGFSESLVYSGRSPDFAYLTPLSFFKSLEHANRDRDNSALGLDASWQVANGVVLKGNFMLDDLVFGNIGKDAWGNKSAWTAGIRLAPRLPLDLALEYSVVYPYTFSHFNFQNSMTNDGQLFAGSLPPNSDELLARLSFWTGNRYPMYLECSYRRHGRNILDAQGNILKNVGGDILQTKRDRDSEIAPFLDGDMEKQFAVAVGGAWEIVRGFNIRAAFHLTNTNGTPTHYTRIGIRYGDF